VKRLYVSKFALMRFRMLICADLCILY